MTQTPSEAAVRASGRILAAIVNTPNGKKFTREEGARLIDEAYGTKEVVKQRDEYKRALARIADNVESFGSWKLQKIAGAALATKNHKDQPDAQ